MSKLLRLPLTLLAVLAALFFLPGVAWGDPVAPSADECAADPTLTGCPPPDSGSVVDPTLPGNPVVDPPAEPEQKPPADNATPPRKEQSPSGGTLARTAGTSPQLTVGEPDLTTDPPDLCTTFPQAPICSQPNPPTVPLTCDGLAQVLGLPAGCPSSFSCADLADLLGLTCPAGPPSCQALADLFHLGSCPEPPTNCREFADLLGVDHCSDIPCMDTSQLPAQAREGLAPLLDGLKAIGIKECPAKTPTTHPGQGTSMPPQAAAQQQQEPYYANCDDARAHGATNIPRGTPGYRPELDRDNDGFACDEAQTAVAPTATQPTGRLAFTGFELGPQLNVAWTLLVLGAGLLIVGRRRT